MVVRVYRAGKVPTSKRRQFQVRLNRAQQVPTIWSEANQQRAIERLEGEIHQITPTKRKLLDKLFQHYEQQRLQEVRTKETGPRSIFSKTLSWIRTAAEEEA